MMMHLLSCLSSAFPRCQIMTFLQHQECDVTQPKPSAPARTSPAGAAPAGAADRGRNTDMADAASHLMAEEGAEPTVRPASRRPSLRRLGGALRRGSSSGASWSSVGTTAVAKVLVMGVSGLFGLVNTSLIIRHFGADAFAQYGLLATFPTLMPFTDLGIGKIGRAHV